MHDGPNLWRQVALAKDIIGDVGQLLEPSAMRLVEFDALGDGCSSGVVKVHVSEPQRRWGVRWQVIPSAQVPLPDGRRNDIPMTSLKAVSWQIPTPCFKSS